METIPKSSQKCYCFIFRWNLLLCYGDLNNCILLDPKKGHLTQFGEPVDVCVIVHVCPGKDKALSPTIPFSLILHFRHKTLWSHLFLYQNIFKGCLFTLNLCE